VLEWIQDVKRKVQKRQPTKREKRSLENSKNRKKNDDRARWKEAKNAGEGNTVGRRRKRTLFFFLHCVEDKCRGNCGRPLFIRKKVIYKNTKKKTRER
jgi:hypothetical protein